MKLKDSGIVIDAEDSGHTLARSSFKNVLA
jgi:hypothetical protein